MNQQQSLGKHPCPECGGDLQWTPTKQSLACPYCGTVVPWSPAQEAQFGDPIQEVDLLSALSKHPAEQREWGKDKREVMCQSCHAISVFVDGKVAKRCDFCGSPSIIPHESQGDAITPQSVLPFKFSDGQIRESIRQWYGSRWFAPNKLKNIALTDTLHGVYLPYWTFDAHVSADWTAEAGHYYYTTESYRDSQGKTQTKRVRHTRWESARGHLNHFFDDELIPGTVGTHEKLLRQIEPFPTLTDLKPYTPDFVRGWTVERYQVDLRKASDLNLQDLKDKTRSMCAGKVPGDTHRNLQVADEYTGRTFKHVLVPVWIVSYTYGSKNYQVLANGHTGELAGEHPLSWMKIFFAVLAFIVVALIIFAVIGEN